VSTASLKGEDTEQMYHKHLRV